jgi:hypothetical protein
LLLFQGTGSAAAAAAAGEGDVGRFLAAVERMGLPGFSPSDLDTVSLPSSALHQRIRLLVVLDYPFSRR